MKYSVNALLFLLSLGSVLAPPGGGDPIGGHGHSLNPFDVVFTGMMDEGDYLERGKGLAAAAGTPKVEIGLEEQGFVALFNPDPFQAWVSHCGGGGKAKNHPDHGFVLLDDDGDVIETFFQKKCQGVMKMYLDTDGVVEFKIDEHLVGHLDVNGNPNHLDCPVQETETEVVRCYAIEYRTFQVEEDIKVGCI